MNATRKIKMLKRYNKLGREYDAELETRGSTPRARKLKLQMEALNSILWPPPEPEPVDTTLYAVCREHAMHGGGIVVVRATRAELKGRTWISVFDTFTQAKRDAMREQRWLLDRVRAHAARLRTLKAIQVVPLDESSVGFEPMPKRRRR